jgi:hypothetical protein
MYFSYTQFMVFDHSIDLPGCAWTEAHSAQGFARRESAVCFNSILEFGDADISVIRGAYDLTDQYDRVISVPFTVTSGKVAVEGPEECDVNRVIELRNGVYRLVAAQRVVNDTAEEIDLYFELLQAPLQQSEVLVADENLNPPEKLLEVADVAIC